MCLDEADNTKIQFSEREVNDDTFIDLNRLRVEGSIREVDAPEQLTKPAIQGRNKQVNNEILNHLLFLVMSLFFSLNDTFVYTCTNKWY